MIESHHFLTMSGDERQRLFRRILLHGDRRLGVDRVRRVLQGRAAVVHAELAVRRRVEHVAVIGKDGVFNAHQIEDALDLTGIADGIAIEAADEVDLLVWLTLQLGRRSGLAIPEVLDNALQCIIVSGDMAADEGGRMRERDVVCFRH